MAAASVSSFLEKFDERHKGLIAEVQQGVMLALQAENRKLTKELAGCRRREIQHLQQGRTRRNPMAPLERLARDAPTSRGANCMLELEAPPKMPGQVPEKLLAPEGHPKIVLQQSPTFAQHRPTTPLPPPLPALPPLSGVDAQGLQRPQSRSSNQSTALGETGSNQRPPSRCSNNSSSSGKFGYVFSSDQTDDKAGAIMPYVPGIVGIGGAGIDYDMISNNGAMSRNCGSANEEVSQVILKVGVKPSKVDVADGEAVYTSQDESLGKSEGGTQRRSSMKLLARQRSMGSTGRSDAQTRGKDVQMRRLRLLFNMDLTSRDVSIEDVLKFLNTRHCYVSRDEFCKMLQEVHDELHIDDYGYHLSPLMQAYGGPGSLLASETSIRLRALVNVIEMPGIVALLPSVHQRHNFTEFIRIIGAITVDEIVNDATRQANDGNDSQEPEIESWEMILNSIVGGIVVLNLMAMGAQQDFEQSHQGWIWFEGFCTLVFIVEMCLKLRIWGATGYFCSNGKYWNWLDAFVTAIAVWDSVVTILQHVGALDEVGLDPSFAILLRSLRLARIVRLVKLLRSPLFKHLTSMLHALTIGVPALLWVLVLLIGVLYTFGLLLRMLLGPTTDQKSWEQCNVSTGDDVYFTTDDMDCSAAYLYGREFFGNVKVSMFTTFRWMIGDFSTLGGKSLAVVFSQGYGIPFQLFYFCSMVTVIFGIFNIITAIFVDTTIAGLYKNDTRRKYAKQYEKQFVKGKLKRLLARMSDIVSARRGLTEDMNVTPRPSTLSRDGEADLPELTEDDFMCVMDDSEVRRLLEELDVEVHNPAGMFDAFDPDGKKVVSTCDLVQAILKLRGQPQKNDLIASFVAIRALHTKLDELAKALTLAAGETPQDRDSIAQRGEGPRRTSTLVHNGHRPLMT